MKITLNIIVCLLLFTTKAQENLVPNGSFEEYNWCPDGDTDLGLFYINACKYWTSPSLGSPNYFNACSSYYDASMQTYMYGVPENFNGFQKAHTGNAYVSLVYNQTQIETQTYAEYIQIKLKKQLEAGKYYHLQFYVSNADSLKCVNSIGALLTNIELNINNDEIIPITPQFQSDLSIFFCDTLKWYEMNYTFNAIGDESYLIIGVFTPMPLIQVSNYNGNILIDEVFASFYIDDVALIELDYISLIKDKIPNIFTPNGDGINDFFTFDNSLIKAKKMIILNRWGDTVFKSDSNFIWNGIINGEYCDDGVYFYTIEINDKININGFLTLIK
jgi:gliding motility-associated-like protein